MVASVWVRRSSENTTVTQWRVCIYHSAPSKMVCPVISSKHKAWAQSWISSIGSGLGLPRLYSTGFRRPVFASTSTKSNTSLMPSSPLTHAPSAQSAPPCAFPARPNPPAHATPCPVRSNSSPPTPARCESTHIDADRRRSVAGRKGESGACPDFPLGFRLKVRSSFTTNKKFFLSIHLYHMDHEYS